VNLPPPQQLPVLAEHRGFVHGFIGRLPGIDVATGREEAMRRLASAHETLLRETLGSGWPLHTARQVHGNRVLTRCAAPASETPPEADGLVTNQPGLLLGVYVADCAPVYLLDPVRRAVGMVHSGKVGSALGIVRTTIRLMTTRYGSRAEDLILAIGPCIRPPDYEIDFAATIREDARLCGVRAMHDDGTNTAVDAGRFYSYRREQGRTGRMLAFIGIVP